MFRHLSTRSISSKSMHAFLSNLADRQTDKQARAKTFTSCFVRGNNGMSLQLGFCTFFSIFVTQEEPLKLDIRTIRSIAVVVVQLKLPSRLIGCLPVRNIYSFVMACRRRIVSQSDCLVMRRSGQKTFQCVT